MTRTLLLCTVLLAGCDGLYGSPQERAPCSASADCPAGQFCAPTGSGSVCWPDAVPPTVGGVTVACAGSPCLRDAALTVEAQVADDQALGAVSVALDLDGGARSVAMTSVDGARYRATLDLSEWPVAGLSAVVTATVRAVDGAGNAGTAVAPAAQRPVVTRARGAVALGGGAVVVPTAPALLGDGTVVVGGSTGKLYALAPGAATVMPSSVGLGAAIVQAPAVGQSALWIAAGNRLFAVSADLASVLNGAGYDTGGAIAGPPALTAAVPTASAPEVAFVGSAAGRMAAVKAEAVGNGLIDFTRIIDPFAVAPALANDATLFAVTSSVAPPAALLRRFTYDGAIGEGPTRAVGQLVTAPLAAAASGTIWTGSAELSASTLQATSPDGTPGPSIPLGGSAGGSAVILAGGDVAISVGNELRRFSAAGALAWSAPLSGAGLTPLVLAGPGGEGTLLVPTRAGTVDALDASDGTLRWSASLSVNELREGTVRAAPAARTSTAWFTSADGLLHGLVVDGALDAAAPWPKAWHDARNSGNLAAGR